METEKLISYLDWVDAKKVFPPFDKKVLAYYTLNSKNEDGSEIIYEYYVICICDSIIESNSGKFASWRDLDYNSVEPLFWCELPKPPNQK